MADISATGPAIQRDWDNRDFTQGIQLNILKITQFLNRFGEQANERGRKGRGQIDDPFPHVFPWPSARLARPVAPRAPRVSRATWGRAWRTPSGWLPPNSGTPATTAPRLWPARGCLHTLSACAWPARRAGPGAALRRLRSRVRVMSSAAIVAASASAARSTSPVVAATWATRSGVPQVIVIASSRVLSPLFLLSVVSSRRHETW